MSADIDAMRASLQQAMERAAQSDDREVAGRVRDEGRRLIFLINGLLRVCQLYDSENAAFEVPAQECSQALDFLIDILGTVHVVCVEDQIYVNDVRLRINEREQPVVDHVVSELERHHVGGISFHHVLKPAQFKSLVQHIARPASEDGFPRTALQALFQEIGDIHLMGIHRFQIHEPTEQEYDYEEAVRRGESAVREAMESLSSKRVPNPLPIRRAVIELVGSVKDVPDEALGAPIRLTSGSVGERHLLSVASLSVLLGQAIGLSDSALSDLGVVAMLHDAGYSQGARFTGHESVGVWTLMRQRGFHEAKIRRLLGVLNHHSPFKARNRTGPLNPIARRPPSLFARILHIVDDYDVLTARRAGQPPPMSPATSLEHMWAYRGTNYDPDLLAVFVQLLGRFPPGTLLELHNGRWAVSIAGGRDAERFEWPVVRIVREADGTHVEAREEIDLFLLRDEITPPRPVKPAGASSA